MFDITTTKSVTIIAIWIGWNWGIFQVPWVFCVFNNKYNDDTFEIFWPFFTPNKLVCHEVGEGEEEAWQVTGCVTSGKTTNTLKIFILTSGSIESILKMIVMWSSNIACKSSIADEHALLRPFCRAQMYLVSQRINIYCRLSS